jgi:hypothetical protein
VSARWVTRICLIVIAIVPLAFVVTLLLIWPTGTATPIQTASAASAAAGAFAVTAAAISAWIATRVWELQEDSLKPYPYPYFDARSRNGLLLVGVKNFGGSAAHNVIVEWEQAPLDSHGQKIEFGVNGVIPVLLPGEIVSRIVDGTIQYFGRKERHEYRGVVRYKNSSGRDARIPFVASAEKFSGTPLYEDEVAQTHDKLQKLPDALKEISGKLDRVFEAIGTIGKRGDH